MRRRGGNQLVRNEERVLLAALRLTTEGEPRLYGYELFATLKLWEGAAPMNHGTLYRCLRSLEQRGMFRSEVESVDPDSHRTRVYYSLTSAGITAGRMLAHPTTSALSVPSRPFGLSRTTLPAPGPTLTDN